MSNARGEPPRHERCTVTTDYHWRGRLQCEVRCESPVRGGSHRPGPPPRSASESRVWPTKPGHFVWQGPGHNRRALAQVSRGVPRRRPLTLGLREPHRVHLTLAVSRRALDDTCMPQSCHWRGRLHCVVQVSR